MSNCPLSVLCTSHAVCNESSGSGQRTFRVSARKGGEAKKRENGTGKISSAVGKEGGEEEGPFICCCLMRHSPLFPFLSPWK